MANSTTQRSDLPTRVLFVCMGNICRSPLAEGIFLHLARKRGILDGFDVDSCGTGGWHAGEPADARMRATAAAHGVELTSAARQVNAFRDWHPQHGFHLIIPMDLDNKRNLLALGAPADRVRMMRSYDPQLAGQPDDSIAVPDPYYGRGDGFENVFTMVHKACAGMIDELTRA